jgi:hypothetical protein
MQKKGIKIATVRNYILSTGSKRRNVKNQHHSRNSKRKKEIRIKSNRKTIFEERNTHSSKQTTKETAGGEK